MKTFIITACKLMLMSFIMVGCLKESVEKDWSEEVEITVSSEMGKYSPWGSPSRCI